MWQHSDEQSASKTARNHQPEPRGVARLRLPPRARSLLEDAEGPILKTPAPADERAWTNGHVVVRIVPRTFSFPSRYGNWRPDANRA
jgi:hypothetical protein